MRAPSSTSGCWLSTPPTETQERMGGEDGGLPSPLHVADFVFMLPTLWIEWLPKGKFVRGAAGGLSLSFEG